jgi:hypothetical protein
MPGKSSEPLWNSPTSLPRWTRWRHWRSQHPVSLGVAITALAFGAFVAVGSLSGCTEERAVTTANGHALLDVATIVEALKEHGVAVQDPQPADPPQPYTREEYTAKIDGEPVEIVTFTDPGQRDQYMDTAASWGFSVSTGIWTVQTDQKQVADRVHAAIGGAIDHSSP